MALRALATPDFIIILRMSINVMSVQQIHFVREETFHTLHAPKMQLPLRKALLAQPALAITGTVAQMPSHVVYAQLENILLPPTQAHVVIAQKERMALDPDRRAPRYAQVVLRGLGWVLKELVQVVSAQSVEWASIQFLLGPPLLMHAQNVSRANTISMKEAMQN